MRGNADANRRVLAATSVSYVVVLLDTSIVNVALDSLSTAFGANISGLQWVVNAYTLMFASLLLTGGTLGDRWGARKVYLAGLIVFTLASVLCGISTSLPVLIFARAVQGIGAAMLVPCSLKLIHRASPDPATRARAIGLWVGLGGVAMAAGPLVGGVLIHWFGWRSVFFVNVPICLAGIVMAQRTNRDPICARGEHIDLWGQVCAIVALATLIGVLIEGRSMGWMSPTAIAGVAVTVAAWTTFLRIEARHPHPMLPLSLFRNGVFSGSTFVSMASAFVFYGLLFLVSLNYQQARGYSPLQTGLAMLPMTAMVAAGSLVAGRLAHRYGSKWTMMVAFGSYAAGAIGLWFATAAATYAFAVAPMLAVGLASGFISPVATAPALETVQPRQTGLAAAALNSARQTGSALGVAIFGSVVGSSHPFEAGLRAALGLVVVVSLVAMLAWWLALTRRAGVRFRQGNRVPLLMFVQN